MAEIADSAPRESRKCWTPEDRFNIHRGAAQSGGFVEEMA
jgi:hypothetical protein